MFILKAEIETVGKITRQKYSGLEISPILDLNPIVQLKSIQTLRLKKKFDQEASKKSSTHRDFESHRFSAAETFFRLTQQRRRRRKRCVS